jgi:hypothetical protein
VADIGPEANRDHVLLDYFTDNDTDVVLARDEVHDGIVDGHVQDDVRMLRAESRDAALDVGWNASFGDLMRTTPEGRSLASLASCRAVSNSDAAGRMRSSRRWPASVSETLRVVLCSTRMPSASSNDLTVWPKAKRPAIPPPSKSSSARPRS